MENLARRGLGNSGGGLSALTETILMALKLTNSAGSPVSCRMLEPLHDKNNPTNFRLSPFIPWERNEEPRSGPLQASKHCKRKTVNGHIAATCNPSVPKGL